MVTPVHKNTNVRLILVVCDVIFCMLAKLIMREGQFWCQKVETSSKNVEKTPIM